MDNEFTLEEITEHINDEYGEYLLLLCSLDRYDYLMPEKFKNAVKKQIKLEKTKIGKNFRIFKTKETIVKEIERLVHYDENEFDDSETIKVI